MVAVEKGACAGRSGADTDRSSPEGGIAADKKGLAIPTPLGIAGRARHVGTRLGLRVLIDGPHFDDGTLASRTRTSARGQKTLRGVGGIGVVGHGSVGCGIHPQIVLGTGHAKMHLLGVDKAGLPST